jgi:hypothetical protein
MKFLFSLLIFIVLLLCASCKNDKYDIIQGTITRFNVPDTLRLGEAAIVEVMFRGGNDGCAQPAHLKWFVEGNMLSVKAYYKYPKMTQGCLMYIPTHKLTIPIIPRHIGQFIIVATDGSGVVREVVVE